MDLGHVVGHMVAWPMAILLQVVEAGIHMKGTSNLSSKVGSFPITFMHVPTVGKRKPWKAAVAV